MRKHLSIFVVLLLVLLTCSGFVLAANSATPADASATPAAQQIITPPSNGYSGEGNLGGMWSYMNSGFGWALGCSAANGGKCSDIDFTFRLAFVILFVMVSELILVWVGFKSKKITITVPVIIAILTCLSFWVSQTSPFHKILMGALIIMGLLGLAFARGSVPKQSKMLLWILDGVILYLVFKLTTGPAKDFFSPSAAGFANVGDFAIGNMIVGMVPLMLGVFTIVWAYCGFVLIFKRSRDSIREATGKDATLRAVGETIADTTKALWPFGKKNGELEGPEQQLQLAFAGGGMKHLAVKDLSNKSKIVSASKKVAKEIEFLCNMPKTEQTIKEFAEKKRHVDAQLLMLNQVQFQDSKDTKKKAELMAQLNESLKKAVPVDAEIEKFADAVLTKIQTNIPGHELFIELLVTSGIKGEIVHFLKTDEKSAIQKMDKIRVELQSFVDVEHQKVVIDDSIIPKFEHLMKTLGVTSEETIKEPSEFLKYYSAIYNIGRSSEYSKVFRELEEAFSKGLAFTLDSKKLIDQIEKANLEYLELGNTHQKSAERIIMQGVAKLRTMCRKASVSDSKWADFLTNALHISSSDMSRFPRNKFVEFDNSIRLKHQYADVLKDISAIERKSFIQLCKLDLNNTAFANLSAYLHIMQSNIETSPGNDVAIMMEVSKTFDEINRNVLGDPLELAKIKGAKLENVFDKFLALMKSVIEGKDAQKATVFSKAINDYLK